jgi:dTDP-4-amino-4,6-dideoxygalactose transaminase
MLALKAAQINPGDEVITSPLTFAATVNAILAVGAKPVFADVKLDGTINPNKMVFTDKTRAIIPVHLHGRPCQMDTILQIAKEERCVVIEDAAHGYGGQFWGRPLGTLGDYGVFSFYPTKNIASCDGGMVVAENPDDLYKVRILASQGLSIGAWKRYSNEAIAEYEVALMGFKGLMNDVSAAIALAQLRRWPDLRRKRNAVFSIYEDAFGKDHPETSQHIYEIRVQDREKVRKGLYDRGIGTGVHYKPLHLEPAYGALGYKTGDFPTAESIGSKTLTLPLSATMTEEDAHRVVKAVNEVKS